MTTLTALREARGETLEDVQRATGVHISTVSRIERGQMPRNASRAQVLATYYGLGIPAFYAAVMAGLAQADAKKSAGVAAEHAEAPVSQGELFQSNGHTRRDVDRRESDRRQHERRQAERRSAAGGRDRTTRMYERGGC